MKNKKIIVTDVDGVLLKWQSRLLEFAQDKNIKELNKVLEIIETEEFLPLDKIFNCDKETAKKLKREYHNSDYLKDLIPYIDAVENINILKNEYEFVAVTTLSQKNKNAYKNRKENLNKYFLDETFKELFLTEDNKLSAFKEISDKYGNDNIIAYVDDLAIHIDEANAVFGKTCKKYQMLRGDKKRELSKNALFITNWHDIKIDLMSK